LRITITKFRWLRQIICDDFRNTIAGSILFITGISAVPFCCARFLEWNSYHERDFISLFFVMQLFIIDFVLQNTHALIKDPEIIQQMKKVLRYQL